MGFVASCMSGYAALRPSLMYVKLRQRDVPVLALRRADSRGPRTLREELPGAAGAWASAVRMTIFGCQFRTDESDRGKERGPRAPNMCEADRASSASLTSSLFSSDFTFLDLPATRSFIFEFFQAVSAK